MGIVTPLVAASLFAVIAGNAAGKAAGGAVGED
jgi:hypothetical protein